MLFNHSYNPPLHFRCLGEMLHFDQRMRNIQRLIDHNNRRAALGLRPLKYPEALIDFHTAPARELYPPLRTSYPGPERYQPGAEARQLHPRAVSPSISAKS